MSSQLPFNSNFDPEIEPNPEDSWERFALLSAYLDGEVSTAEIAEVEKLLADDPGFYRVHQEQIQIRQMLAKMPVRSPIEPEMLIDRVFTKINLRQKRRNLSLAALAVVTTLIAASLSFFNFSSRDWSLANFNNPDSDDESLVLAMEYPIVPSSSLPGIEVNR
jgi:hypothetical protein